MDRSSIRPTIFVLASILILIMGLATTLGACADLGSEDEPATDSTAATAATAAATDDQARIPADYILFRDDFQDGDTEGWQVSGAWVVQQDGDLYTFDATGQGYALVPAGVGWEGDYAFKTSYLLTSGTVAFSFDATSGGRYYVPVDEQRISLVKEDAAGDKAVLAQAQAPAVGALHYLTIAKQRGTIQVYVDKTLWLAAQDNAPLTVGTIAVGSADGTTASVDNVLVNKIVRALPQGTPTVPSIAPGELVEPADDGADLNELPAPDQEAPELPDNNQGQNLPEPEVNFYGVVNEDTYRYNVPVPADQDLRITWSVQDAMAVFLDGAPQPLSGSLNVAAGDVVDHTYQLEVLAFDGRTLTYQLAVTSEERHQSDAHGPDLTISCQVEVVAGTQVRVSITLHNNGGQDTQATFRWYAHAQSGQVNMSETYGVSSGGQKGIGFTYDYGQSGTMHWKATVATAPEGLDVNTSNNSVTGTVTVQK
jgi:hypothetical protein